MLHFREDGPVWVTCVGSGTDRKPFPRVDVVNPPRLLMSPPPSLVEGGRSEIRDPLHRRPV